MPADFWGNMINWIIGEILNSLIIEFIAWWYYPILAIFANNWNQYYSDFTSFKLYAPGVSSYKLTLNN